MTKPGDIELTRMLYLAKSIAIPLVAPTKPAFDAEYTDLLDFDISLQIEPIFIILPDFFYH